MAYLDPFLCRASHDTWVELEVQIDLVVIRYVLQTFSSFLLGEKTTHGKSDWLLTADVGGLKLLHAIVLYPERNLILSKNLRSNHLLLDRPPNIGPLISRWKLDEFKNCWNKSFRTSKILTLLYQMFSNFLIFQRNMSGPRLGALSNNRWSRGI